MKKLVIFLILLFPVISVAKAKVILHIPAYHAGYNWTDTCVAGIEKGLGNRYKIITHYMDTKRLPKNEHPQAVKKAWEKYLEIKPDMVILGDDNALAYLGTKLAGNDIPVVYYGINANPRAYFKDHRIPKNITGVLERPLFIPSIRFIKKIMPEVKNILILLDDSNTSIAIIKYSFNGKRILNIGGIKASTKIIGTYKEWKKTVKESHNNYDIILLSTFFTLRNEKKKVEEYSEVLQWTSKNTPIPLFGTLAFHPSDEGTVGALVIVGEKHGMLAADIAKKILQGTPPNKIYPSMDSVGQLIFNQKQLNRYNIKLPETIKMKSLIN